MIQRALIFCLFGTCFTQKIISIFDDKFLPLGDDYKNKIKDDSDNKSCADCYSNPDEYLTAPQIIRRHGYVSESHVVETTDGFLLTLHRIPVSRTGKIGKQPVFLQHGLLSSSADWVVADNKSLAFILSDLGYDVWLGNARGNTYSRGHVLFPPNSAEFWNFTFHEMGVYDLPAVLSHVSNTTGKGGEIIYIGHSMGTTMFYVFASTFPVFASNMVKIMVGLAPVAYTTHMVSPVRYIAPWVNNVEWIAKHLGFKEFLPNQKILKFMSYDCELLKIDNICEDLIFVFCGFDKDQFDMNMLPVIVAHSPAGSSTKTIIHFAQEIHHGGDFMQFDYGEAGNLIQYGIPTPPLYNISNIVVPTYFMFAENDWAANPLDVYRLAKVIRKNIGLYDVPLKTFNHIDFLWAKDAPKLVYDKLIEVIRNYSSD